MQTQDRLTFNLPCQQLLSFSQIWISTHSNKIECWKLEIMEESSATILETKLDLNKCQSCQKSFKSLLGHLNNSRNTKGCKDNYNSEELAHLESKSKEKSRETDKIWVYGAFVNRCSCQPLWLSTTINVNQCELSTRDYRYQ